MLQIIHYFYCLLAFPGRDLSTVQEEIFPGKDTKNEKKYKSNLNETFFKLGAQIKICK